MDKIITFGHETRKRVLEGIHMLRRPVQSTHGPNGRNVIINKGNAQPVFTKDGATVAFEVDSNDPYLQIGIQMGKGVIDKVDSMSGDGTTTTTIYFDQLCTNCEHLVSLDLNANEVRKGVNIASNAAEAFLKSKAIPTTDIRKVASLASNGSEEITKLLVEAFSSIGDNGVVELADSYRRNGESYVSKSGGMSWNTGIPSTLFVTEEADASCKLEEPYIMIYGTGLSDLDEARPMIEQSAREQRNIVIIAPMFDPSLYDYASQNGVALCYAPGKSLSSEKMMEQLQDLAIVTGTVVIPDMVSTSTKIKSLSDLGTAELFISKVNHTSVQLPEEISKEKFEKIKTHVNNLKHRLETEDDLTQVTMEALRERIAKLDGGIATIHVGAPTPIEKEEKIALMTDAMNSVKSALKHGILPGGGVAMLKAAVALEEDKSLQKGLSDEALKGYGAVCNALRECAKHLLSTVWPEDYQWKLQEIAHEEDFNVGYDLITGKKCDLVKAGVVDAAAIEWNVVHYSNSTCGSFLLSDGIIVNGRNNVAYDYNDRTAAEALINGQ